MKSKLIFIPSNRDEAKFLELIHTTPNMVLLSASDKHPFYTIIVENSGVIYVRKIRNIKCNTSYPKLTSDDVAALYLLPKEAIEEFLFSL